MTLKNKKVIGNKFLKGIMGTVSIGVKALSE